MTGNLPPGLILIAGALLLPLIPRRARGAFMLALPVIGFAQLLTMPADASLHFDLLGLTLEPLRVDRLSLAFGYVFYIAAFLSLIFALGVRDTMQHVAALVYAGSSLAAVFAGDLITLFVFWEMTAVTSVFLIWASRSERSFRAGMRYLYFQVGSGVLLLIGLAMHVVDTGSIEFGQLDAGTPGGMLMLIAFGIKCAFPFLHTWLGDAYPEATGTGTVFLSSFTTKLAVYALARGFAGMEELIWVGAVMTAFPIFFAVIENDLRRVLAYSTNNQLGFMVVGIGLGTQMALDGAVAHAFAHILFKGLLFMSMGAVLLRAGTVKGSELGGLYKSMPWTAAFCMVGAASISAFPLFSGFVTKSLIISATAENGYAIVWGVLLFASAGVFHHSGIKIPYFTFFAHDSGIRVKEAPLHMLVAMGAMAVLCVAIGVFPGTLYALLPFKTDYHAYTTTHVVAQLQLLLFSGLAFSVLVRTGIYPPEKRGVNLDADWFWRKPGLAAVRGVGRVAVGMYDAMLAACRHAILRIVEVARATCGGNGVFSRTWLSGTSALFAALLLAILLALYYL